jgi:hypothetical protein
MTKLVACGEFVKRQTKDSGFSHFEGTWEELEHMVHSSLVKPQLVRPGYKDGVVLVDLCPGYEHRKFYTSIVKLDENTKFSVGYSPRRVGEAPYIRIGAKAEKQLAKYVSFVCYRKDILMENDERETDAEWEIVCIKARVSEEEEPMDPYTMARNFLHLKGGTKGDFSAEDFAKSIVYWNNHANTTGKPKWYRKVKSFFKQVWRDAIDGMRQYGENIFHRKEL